MRWKWGWGFLFLSGVVVAGALMFPRPLERARRFDLRGEWERAIPLYRRALENRPEDWDTALRYAELLARTGRTDAAVRELERIVRESPDPFSALLLLARVHEHRQEPREALDWMEKAWRERRSDVELLAELTDGLWWFKNYDRLYGVLREARESGVALPDPLLRRFARAAEKTGRWEEALELRRELVGRLPQDREALSGLAELYQRQGDVERELEIRRRLAELAPESDLPLRYAHRLERLERWEEALEAYRKLHRRFPDDRAIAESRLAAAYHAQDEAFPEYAREYLDRWPDDPDVKSLFSGWGYERAEERIRAGRWREGIGLYEELVRRTGEYDHEWRLWELRERYRPRWDVGGEYFKGPRSERRRSLYSRFRFFPLERLELEAGTRLRFYDQEQEPPFREVNEEIPSEWIRAELRILPGLWGWGRFEAYRSDHTTQGETSFGLRGEWGRVSGHVSVWVHRFADDPIELTSYDGSEDRWEGELRLRTLERTYLFGGWRERRIEGDRGELDLGGRHDLGRDRRSWIGVEQVLRFSRPFLSITYRYTDGDFHPTDRAVFDRVPFFDEQQEHSWTLYAQHRWGRFWEAQGSVSGGIDPVRNVEFLNFATRWIYRFRDRWRIAAGYEYIGESTTAVGGESHRWTVSGTMLF